MPRSIHDIVDHADQLAERFEQLEPDQLAEIPVEEYLLQRAVIARARSEQQLLDAVATARANGLPWQTIGAIIGTSAQAAHQRYGALVDRRDATHPA
jgi:FAD/FMN-containing dehydrogenase